LWRVFNQHEPTDERWSLLAERFLSIRGPQVVRGSNGLFSSIIEVVAERRVLPDFLAPPLRSVVYQESPKYPTASLAGNVLATSVTLALVSDASLDLLLPRLFSVSPKCHD